MGATIPEATLVRIIKFAKTRGIIVMADEAYRPLFHSLPANEPNPPSIISLGYDKIVATSSMSKAWPLAGISVGWIASKDPSIIEAVKSARNYTTISVSQLDDRIAAFALSESVRPRLLQRNIDLARTNLALLAKLVETNREMCDWVKPSAGTTAMIRFKRNGELVKDDDFCLEILKETGVLLMPGSSCFGNGERFQGYMRFGYVCNTELLQEALDKLSDYLQE